MAKLKFETTANLKPIDDLLTRIKELEQHIASLKKEMRSINAADPKIDPLLKDLKASKEEINNLVAEINRIKQAQLDRQHEQEQAATREKEFIASLLRAYEELRQKVADTANKSTSPSSGANNAPSIKEETQAYDELLSKIRTLLGSREETIASMLREENAIRLIKKELKGLQKLESDGINLTEAQRQRRIQLTSSLEEHKQSVSQLKQILANEIKSEQAVRGSMNEMSQSLGTMRMFYRTLNEEERNTQFGQEILKRIQLVDTKIKELDASIGNHQRNVGNYASHWDSLGFSIQQVARELPSISYGLNVFFGAISNNLPILADDIRRAIAKYKAAVAEGKEATPVWKQIVKSIFSWQTALVGGITLLTLYGNEIADWVAGLFKGKDAIDANAASIEVLNTRIEANRNALDSANREFGSQMGNISRLRSEWSKLGNDMNAKLKFVNDNKSGFSQLGVSVNSVADAEKVLIGNTDAVVASLKARAQATAYQNTLTELYAKQLEAEQRQEAYEAQAKGRRYVPGVQEDARKRAIWTAASLPGYMSAKEEYSVERLTEGFLNEETQKYERAAEKERLIKEGYAKQIQEVDKRLTKSLNQSAQALIEAGLTPSDDNTTGQITQDKILSAREALAEALRANESELQKSLLGIMAEGQEKELAQLDNATREKLHKIEEARQKTIAAYATKGQEPNPDELAKLDETKANEEKAAELARAAIVAKYARQEEELWRNVTDVFLTDEERKRQGIQKTFDEYRRQAESLLKGGSIGESDYNALVGEIGRAETKSMLQDVLREYETFEQQKARIAEEYNDKIAQLEEQNANGQYNENIEEIKRQRDLEIAQLQISESDFFQVISGNLEEYGLATIRDAIAQAKEYLDNFIADAKSKNGGKLTNEQLQFVTQMRQDLDKATKVVHYRLPEGLAKAASGMKKVVDSAKELDESLGNVLDTVSNMIQGFSDIESGISGLKEASANFKQMKQDAKDQGKSLGFGDILGTVGSYAGAIGSIVSGVTSIFGSLFSSKGNSQEVEATIERLTVRNELLQEAIERLTDKIGSGSVMDSVQAYEKAVEKQKEQNENYRKIAEAKGSYWSSHHSWNYNWGGFTDEELAWIQKNVRKEFTNKDSIFSLTPEEMATLLENTGIADRIYNTAGSYGRDVYNTLVDYAGQAGKLEELTDKLNESLTQISFDSLRDSFVDNLMDMDKSAEDFADDFRSYLMRAVLNSKISELLDDELNNFYEKWVEYTKSGGGLDKGEIDELKGIWDGITEKGIKIRDELAAITGHTSGQQADSQSATSRGYQTMSQDDGNELNGRFSDLQMKGQQIIDINTGIRDIASEIRQLQVESLLELRGINENTGNTVKILKMHTSMLSRISDNTSRI
ncbi:MAG: hypothetical protein DBY24_06915 [Prevotellaceae bacterium]|nr:MAG: hypothetical protein DBY24_06915 [Prevotellaceae bacterium]